MSTSYSYRGDTIQWLNDTGVAVVVNQPVVVGNVGAGIAREGIANGAYGTVEMVGVHTLTKATSETWAQGDRLYYSTASANCSKTPSATRFFIGTADLAAGSSATTGSVRLAPFGEAGGTKLAITATTTLAAHHFASGPVIVEANTTGGAVTINLPTLTGLSCNPLILRVTAGTNALAIDPAGSETFDAATFDAANDRGAYYPGVSTWSLIGPTIA